MDARLVTFCSLIFLTCTSTSKGFFSAAIFLLEKNADPNCRDKNGVAPIHWACHGKYVMDLNINYSHFNNYDVYTNLCSDETLVKYLVDKCQVDLNPKDKNERTPLHHACR